MATREENLRDYNKLMSETISDVMRGDHESLALDVDIVTDRLLVVLSHIRKCEYGEFDLAPLGDIMRDMGDVYDAVVARQKELM